MSSVVIGTWVAVSTMLVGPAELLGVHCEGGRCAAFVRSLVDMGDVRADHVYSFPFYLSEKDADDVLPDRVSTGFVSEVEEDPSNPFGFSNVRPIAGATRNIEAILFKSKDLAMRHLHSLSATTEFSWREVGL